MNNPAELGDFRVFNQFTEQFTVGELAERVKKAAEELGHTVEIQSFPNPRVELEEHYYNAANTKLRDLGLEPHLLGAELVQSMLHTIERYRDRVIERAILPKTRWKPGELSAQLRFLDYYLGTPLTFRRPLRGGGRSAPCGGFPPDPLPCGGACRRLSVYARPPSF